MILQCQNLSEETTGHILFYLYLELNFSLEEDRSKSEAHFKLADSEWRLLDKLYHIIPGVFRT